VSSSHKTSFYFLSQKSYQKNEQKISRVHRQPQLKKRRNKKIQRF